MIEGSLLQEYYFFSLSKRTIMMIFKIFKADMANSPTLVYPIEGSGRLSSEWINRYEARLPQFCFCNRNGGGSYLQLQCDLLYGFR